jgi:colicin import membrane protein
MEDADFDPPEAPKPAPMRRPTAARGVRPAAGTASAATAALAPVPAILEGAAKEVADLLEHNPAKVLQDPKALELVLAEMRTELDAFKPDTSTDKGRRAIASFAHKFARSKTAIDEAGKKLNEDLRAQINAVDEVRRAVRQRFDEYRDEARKPLDDWEAEQERKAETIKSIETAIAVRIGPLDTAADIKEVIDRLSALEIDEELLGAAVATALAEKRLEALNDIVATHERVRRAEEDRAELDRVKAENERLEREALDRKREQIAAEQKARDESTMAIERVRIEGEQKAKAAEIRSTLDTSRALYGTLQLKPLRELFSKIVHLDISQAGLGAEFLSVSDLATQLSSEIHRRIGELEMQAQQAARQEHRKKVNTAVRDAVLAAVGGEKYLAKDKANALVIAMRDGQIPRIRIDYTEGSDL